MLDAIKKASYEIKLLILYRGISLLATSSVFLMNDMHPIVNKATVITCLTIVSIISTYHYINNQDSPRRTTILVFIETIGNSFLLMPSGGFNSPYIWYALNTFLIAFLKLGKVSCFINLFTYLLTSAGISFFIKRRVYISAPRYMELNVALSFLLVVVVMLLLVNLLKKMKVEQEKLVQTNKELLIANKKNKESRDHIMALYQSVHLFTRQKDVSNLINYLIHYTKDITKTRTVYFKSLLNNQEMIIVSDIDDGGLRDKLGNKLGLFSWKYLKKNKIETISIDKRIFIHITVQSSYRIYGILGIEIVPGKDRVVCELHEDQLKFLSDISAVVLECCQLEEVNERLLITQEQNRIANEIHDTVLQKLFAMSCNMFALIKNIDTINTKQIAEELDLFRDTTDSVMKSLRATIYDLSWRKNGANTFLEDIQNYICEIKRHCNIEILFDIKGNHEILTTAQKKVIYRIICEGISNAVRHGMATQITININIDKSKGTLYIKDNGSGFRMEDLLKKRNIGLGISNMQYIVDSVKGNINIQSEIHKGTCIEVYMPIGLQIAEEAAV